MTYSRSKAKGNSTTLSANSVSEAGRASVPGEHAKLESLEHFLQRSRRSLFHIDSLVVLLSRSIVTTPSTSFRPTPWPATSNKRRKHSCRPSCLNPDRLAQHGNPNPLGRSSGQLVFCAENESSCRRLRQHVHPSPKFRGPEDSLHSRPPRESGFYRHCLCNGQLHLSFHAGLCVARFLCFSQWRSARPAALLKT